ncbi:hypothetical protein C5S53_15805 [Methanophagales archaeon]|nr:hypothetical protein C5S53_15805 [Methanophagales archaeon]
MLPSEGSPQTFNYVFESKDGEFVLELPEGSSVENLRQNSENLLTLCSRFR